MGLTPHAGTYPEKEFTFWETDSKKVNKLNVINREDFPVEEILSWLELDKHNFSGSFGITNSEEIRNRISVIRYLNDNPKIVEMLKTIHRKVGRGLPSSKDEFMNMFDPSIGRTKFWTWVDDLVNAMQKSDMPDKIKVFYDSMRSLMGLENTEREMVKIIGDVLESSAVLEGVFNVECGVIYKEWEEDVPIAGSYDEDGGQKYKKEKKKEVKVHHSGNKDFEQFHGHRTFSYALSAAREVDFPRWTKKLAFRWNIKQLLKPFIAFINSRNRKKAYEMMEIKRCFQVAEDINNGVVEILKKQPDAVLKALSNFNDLRVKVYFSYGKYAEGEVSGEGKGEEGLKIQVLDISRKDSSDPYFEFSFSKFAGYSKKREDKIAKGRQEIKDYIKYCNESRSSHAIYKRISGISKNLYLHKTKILSPKTDATHRWMSLENLYNGDELYEASGAIREFRRFITDAASDLLRIYAILEKFNAKAKEMGTTICFPEVLSSEQNVIEFENLYPMHLGNVLKAKKVVPIDNIPAINGNMIGITGRHGGGKTVTEHTVTGNVYLAQSGLPVFGKSFRLNPKTHLGMVFIDGVSGKSVIQVLVEKMKNVFKGIEKVPGQNVVLVLDELGSATQEKDGMELALKVLSKINDLKASLLFSTQILDVAKEAESRFGAKCFKVDKNHRLQPGIAGGELKDLVNEVGLEKWIK